MTPLRVPLPTMKQGVSAALATLFVTAGSTAMAQDRAGP